MRERREGGPFKSIPDLYDRMANRGEPLNKTAMEGLVYSNALSGFASNKNQILAFFPLLEKRFKLRATDRALDQISIFGEEDDEIPLPDAPALPKKQELEMENAVLGVYLSEHPSRILDPVLTTDKTIIPLEVLMAGGARRFAATCGMINQVKTFYTRAAEQMAVFRLESQFASIPCIVFPSNMASCMGEINDQNIAVITGSYVQNRDDDGLQFIVSSIVNAEAFSDMTRPFPVQVNNKAEQTAVVNYVHANPGTRRVMLCGSNGKNGELKDGVNLTLKTLNYLSGEFRNDVNVWQ